MTSEHNVIEARCLLVVLSEFVTDGLVTDASFNSPTIASLLFSN